MFYGFSRWSNLITEFDDNQESKESDQGNPNNITDCRYYRFPIWLLLSGIGIYLLTEMIVGMV